jgi:hypothetical protein
LSDDVLPDGPDSIGLVSEVIDVDSIFDNEDPDLAPILAQLTSHLESIQANSQQAEGVADAILSTRAALERVLPRDAS